MIRTLGHGEPCRVSARDRPGQARRRGAETSRTTARRRRAVAVVGAMTAAAASTTPPARREEDDAESRVERLLETRREHREGMRDRDRARHRGGRSGEAQRPRRSDEATTSDQRHGSTERELGPRARVGERVHCLGPVDEEERVSVAVEPALGT